MSDTLVQLIADSWLLSVSIKAGALLLGTWLATTYLSHHTAAARSQLWMLAIVGTLLLPIVAWALPYSWLFIESPLPHTASTLQTSTFSVHGTIGTTFTSQPAAALPWLGVLWVLGAAFVTLRFGRGHLAAHRLVRNAQVASNSELLAIVDEAQHSLSLSSKVILAYSKEIRSPMTIGVARPHVLLPASSKSWSSAKLRTVLTHELGHIKRHDTLVQIAAQLSCMLYWWNPLVWLAASKLETEREHACDDLVLNAGTQPANYANDLLEVAREISDKRRYPVAVCMAGPSVEARLERILNSETPRHPLTKVFQWVGITSITGLSLGLACTSASPTSQPVPQDSQSDKQAAPKPGPQLHRGELYIDTGDGVSLDHSATHSHAGIDMFLVAEAIDENIGSLKECYEQALLDSPKLSGDVIIHANIPLSGKVNEQCITHDSVHSAEIVACVNQLITETEFPGAYVSTVDVSFPFSFSPSSVSKNASL